MRRLLPCFVLLFASAVPADESPRYAALLTSGEFIEGNDLKKWQTSPAEAELDGRALFEPGNSVRWIHRRGPAPTLPVPRIELFGGDLLPGEVIGHRPATGPRGPAGDPAMSAAAPERLIVATPAPVAWPPMEARRRRDEAPLQQTGGTVRVDTAWIKRIVWRPRAEHCRPGTVFLRDGREIEYRSLRFDRLAVTVLSGEGPLVLSFSEIAELHFPAMNAGEKWLDLLAGLAPEGAGRLVRYRTEEGLLATANDYWHQLPLPHFASEKDQKQNNPSRYFQVVRPAWSPDPLWLDLDRITGRLYWDINELPLSLIDPVESEKSAGLSASWSWRVDENAQGAPARLGSREMGWTIGMHAPGRLHYDLPAAARSFQSIAGLDRAAGSGGCARAILSGPAGEKSLFTSPILVGSERTVDTGIIDLPRSEAAARRITLSADPVAHDRPQRADPLDVRDLLDWGEPLIQLDAEIVREEIRRRSAGRLGVMERLAQAEGVSQRRLYSHLREAAPDFTPVVTSEDDRQQFQPHSEGAVRSPPFVDGHAPILRRLVEVPEGMETQLTFSVSRHGKSRWELVVMAAGRRIHEQTISSGKEDAWREIRIDLTPFAGRSVPLEIYNLGSHPYWGGGYLREVAVSSHPARR